MVSGKLTYISLRVLYPTDKRDKEEYSACSSEKERYRETEDCDRDSDSVQQWNPARPGEMKLFTDRWSIAMMWAHADPEV